MSGASQTGETTVFWRDLSTAGLIDGSFSTATEYAGGYSNCVTTAISTPSLDAYFPTAKLGQGNYVLVWSGGLSGLQCCGGLGNSVNYFGVGAVPSLTCWGAETNVNAPSATGLSVQQAYAMDRKVDDGMPQSGNVTATFPVGYGWAGTADSSSVPYTTATPGSSTTCFDNGNVAGAAQQYSVEINNGSNNNCALSFQFK